MDFKRRNRLGSNSLGSNRPSFHTARYRTATVRESVPLEHLCNEKGHWLTLLFDNVPNSLPNILIRP